MAGRSFDARWAAAVAAELAAQPLAAAPVLAEADLAPLPPRSGATCWRLARSAAGPPEHAPGDGRGMLRKPGDPGMQATSTQLNWFAARPGCS